MRPPSGSQGILWTILASAEQTGGSYSLIEELCPLHGGPPPHTHRQDEAFYILDGEITLIAGEKKVTANAGSLAYIPAGCVHSFRVEADRTRLLNFYFPGGFEKIVTEFGVAATSRTLPPADLQQRGTPEQMQALFQESWHESGCPAGSLERVQGLINAVPLSDGHHYRLPMLSP